MAVQTTELYATIYQHIVDNVPDSLSVETAFLDWLTKEGKKKQEGGTYIQFPVKTIANAAQGFISGTNALVNVNPSIQLQYGVLNWKYYNFNANFTLADYTAAMGKEQVVDFMDAKVKGCLEDSSREIAIALWVGSNTSTSVVMNGVTTAGNALYPEGLIDIMAASGTSYASLTNTDYSTAAIGTYLPTINTDATVNYANINSLITKLQAKMRSNKKATKIIGLMNPLAYARYKNAVQNQQIFIDNSTILKSGFEGFMVNGVEFYMDADCPGTQDGSTADNYVVIFPVDIMKLYYNFGFGNASPFDGETKMPNQPIMSIQHYMSFNLVCNNRRLVSCGKVFVA